MDAPDVQNNQVQPDTVERLMQQVHRLMEQQARDSAMMAVLRQQNEEIRNQIPSQPSSKPAGFDDMLPPPSPASRRKPFPVGLPYDGTKANFSSWRMTMEFKLRADEVFIGDEEARFMYIWSQLSPAVQRAMAPYFEDGARKRWDVSGFLDYLAFCYSDHHGRERAQVALEHLHQGQNQPFTEFFVNFVQLLTQSGGLHWDDEQKLSRLRRSLNSRMRSVSLNRGVSRTNYNAAVEEYKTIAVDIETASLELGFLQAGKSKEPQQKSNLDRDGDTNMVEVAALSSAPTKPPTSRPNWIPQDLFNARKLAKVCTRCGQGGHFVRACPNALLLQPVGVKTVAALASGPDSGN